MVPLVVARCGLARWLERFRAAFLPPPIHIVVVELLPPQQAGQGLPHDRGLVRREPLRNDGGVERVGVLSTGLQRRLELVPEWTRRFTIALGQGGWRDITEPESYHLGGTGV